MDIRKYEEPTVDLVMLESESGFAASVPNESDSSLESIQFEEW